MAIEYRVERYRRKIVERCHGYLPVEYERQFQRLVRITPGGWFSPRHKILGVEEIPEHVLISLGCYGDTGGWLSKFAEHVK